ncbi:MAG: hypothetical protein Q8K00_00250 [Syntrophales bacterium]|nr:hypothetical protein [Syntrophales bacterium]
MRLFIKILSVVFMGVALITAGALPGFSQENTVRAKIGILVKSGDQIIRAKSRDRLKAGDLVRIYVHPEVSSYVYVVHRDQKTVTLLNMVEQRIQSSTLVLPSVQEYYQVDGQSPAETFTVICSPKEVKEISSLASSQMTHDRWVSLEKDLLKKGEIDLAQKSEKPFAIAGNVRGAGDAAGGDAFVRELQIFSGKSILVRQYEFSVKK